MEAGKGFNRKTVERRLLFPGSRLRQGRTIPKRLDEVVATGDQEHWALKFPHMGAVVRALTFLLKEAPE